MVENRQNWKIRRIENKKKTLIVDTLNKNMCIDQVCCAKCNSK